MRFFTEARVTEFAKDFGFAWKACTIESLGDLRHVKSAPSGLLV